MNRNRKNIQRNYPKCPVFPHVLQLTWLCFSLLIFLVEDFIESCSEAEGNNFPTVPMIPAGAGTHIKTGKNRSFVLLFKVIMQTLYNFYQINWITDIFSGILKLAFFIFLEMVILSRSSGYM